MWPIPHARHPARPLGVALRPRSPSIRRTGRRPQPGHLLGCCGQRQRRAERIAGATGQVDSIEGLSGYCRHGQAGYGAAMMRVLENNYGWNQIDSAPLDEDVTLEVTDGRGAPYRLRNPCRLTASGWVSSNKGTPLAVTPVKWKPYRVPRDKR
jgi:hypothetical protein